MDPMIITQELTRKYGDLAAVDRLDLKVRKGEIFGLVGPDGAGKTTTMRLLSGILRPTSGRATVAGVDLNKNPDDIKDIIGYMPQRFGLYEDLTVDENIRFYGDIFSVPLREMEQRAEKLLGVSRMLPFRKRQAGRLSGGMKQKLGLTCALIHTPELLLLDEPTNGVDPVSRREFWNILYQLLRDGITILISTSYLDEAERCHRVGLIHHGRLISSSRPEELQQLDEGELVEISCSNSHKAYEALKETPGMLAANIYGAACHLVLDDADKRKSVVEAQLKRQGLELTGYRRVKPSLEDVFIAILKRRQQE